MKITLIIFYSLFFILSVQQVNADNYKNANTESLSNSKLSVVIDKSFPVILKYALNSSQFEGAKDCPKEVFINKKKANYEVAFEKIDDSSANYNFIFKDLEIAFTLKLKVDGQTLYGEITNIQEGKTKLYTVSFPYHQLLSITEKDIAPSYIWCRMIPMTDSPDIFSTLKDAPINASPITANYIFMANGKLSAGILSNVIDERERVSLQTKNTTEGKTSSAWCPVWTYRELENETLENPWFRVLIAEDENKDNEINWQDAALLYRQYVKKPFRSDEVKKIVSSQIGFNASHLAENPFLRILDNMKKCALLLDFMPQDLLVKGYQGGGHDSSVPDYAHPNIQVGGFKDLNYLIEKGNDINVKIGLHINCTEAYPESRYFDPAILTKRLGWLWGDQAVLIDKKKDLTSGKLFERINEMFDSIPHIDFLYVDTYEDRGWPLIKINEKLTSHNQRIFTEFDVAMDPVSTWSHGRTRLKDKIVRYIWNDCRDIFGMNPLLFGAHRHGINGWEGEDNVNRFVREVYTQNLPTKFLQHFELLSWTDEKAIFNKGLKTEKQNNKVKGTWGKMTFFEGEWNEQRKNFSKVSLFIPWEPDSQKPERIFTWNDNEEVKEWTLPNNWKKVSKVYIYKLTDRGRIFEKEIAVKGNKFSYQFASSTPFVIYPKKVKEINPKDMKWGEGQPIIDPGFNDYTLAGWEKIGNNEAINVVQTPNGQTSLEISSLDKSGICQRIKGLEPGKAYYFSAWLFIDSETPRKTTLGVDVINQGKSVYTAENYLDKTILNGKKGWQRIRVYTELSSNTEKVLLSIVTEASPNSVKVLVDDIRAYPTQKIEKENNCILFEDFELRDIGWGPFVNTVRGSIYTDLSEFNPGRTADVIDGNFSLKTWNHKKGLLYRTTPGLLRLQPTTTHEIEFDYLCDRDNSYELVVKENDSPDSKELLRIPIQRGKGVIKGKFTTENNPDAWIGIEKTNDDPVIFVMDNLKIVTE